MNKMEVDLGLLVLRATIGLLFAGHGAQKAFGWGGGPGFAGCPHHRARPGHPWRRRRDLVAGSRAEATGDARPIRVIAIGLPPLLGPTADLGIFIVSLGAGLIGALAGVGGGIIIVPALTILFGVDVRLAIGASIVSVIATSSGAAAAYVRDRMTDMHIGMFLELATTSGAIAGALLAALVMPSVLLVLLGIVLLGSAGQQALRLGEELPPEVPPSGPPSGCGCGAATRMRSSGARSTTAPSASRLGSSSWASPGSYPAFSGSAQGRSRWSQWTVRCACR